MSQDRDRVLCQTGCTCTERGEEMNSDAKTPSADVGVCLHEGLCPKFPMSNKANGRAKLVRLRLCM